MPELVIFLSAAVVVGLGLWLLLAGTRPQDVSDEGE